MGRKRRPREMVAPHLSNRKKGSKSDKNLGIILKIFCGFVGDVGREAIDGADPD